MKQASLVDLHNRYEVSDFARTVCIETDPAVVGNELPGSGKDSLIQEIIRVSNGHYVWVPSRKTRELRDGEVEGVAQISVSLSEARSDVVEGEYLEWVPMREKQIYGTHAGDLSEYHLRSGRRPIIDVEPRGLAILGEIYPGIKSIYPLPDLELWLEMLHAREQLPGSDIKDFLATDPDVLDIVFYLNNGYDGEMIKRHADIKKRLLIAEGQRRLVEDLGMHENPNILFIVNNFGRLSSTASLADSFLRGGRSMKHVTSKCPKGRGVLEYLDRVSQLAGDVLATAH